MAKMKIYAIVDLTLHLNKTNPPQLVVTAHGLTTSSDWSAPALVPLEKTLSPDGILDLEFVAQPPSEISLPVLTPICAVLVVEKDVERIVAVRVFSRTNDMIRFLGVAGPGPTTLAIGEEAGGVTTMATGEEDGGDLTTMATGEEEGLAAQRSRAGPTTMATGEEDGGGPTTMATGEEDGGRQGAVTTLALGRKADPSPHWSSVRRAPPRLRSGKKAPR
ncbi:hypothetical protein [Breoghania sp. L-A4]|uniref:hypothetical protein n=1 Tax=Breoghania sp. L-A4 TaxID=2304600 RepID=UPI000E358168|nr:hypothetical protein [Breoghania sp. L-A4]AXS42296.1 hypothetical protein D1F64_22780 [Breoghania sp. L-A4]